MSNYIHVIFRATFAHTQKNEKTYFCEEMKPGANNNCGLVIHCKAKRQVCGFLRNFKRKLRPYHIKLGRRSLNEF